MSTTYAKKVFFELIENIPEIIHVDLKSQRSEGIVTSSNDFFKLMVEANDIFNNTFAISDRDKIIFAENLPQELIQRLNNETAATNITDNTLRDVRIVTYLANEYPGTASAHRLGEKGIQTIKYRFAEVYDDPDFTGYSIIRYKKEIEAEISLKVWGVHYQDIRQRASLIKEMINNSSWYFKKKGLKEIVWLKSNEEEKWDHKEVVKCKTEKYIINFTEIREVREKNIEQIVAYMGLNN
jgi:hypothetical protein